MNLRESQFERATELFYEAAVIPDLWPKALQSVAEAAGAAAATLLPIRAGSNSIIWLARYPRFPGRFHGRRLASYESIMRRGLDLTTAGWNRLITSEDMLRPEPRATNPYVNEVEAPPGLGPKAGIFLVAAGRKLALPMTLERPLSASPYKASEIAKLNRLMFSLNAGARLALKVGFESAVRLADSLAPVGADIALLNGSGRVIHSPPSFDRYMDDGLSLTGGCLRSWRHQADEKLAAAIRQAVAYAPVGERAARIVHLPRRTSRKPLIAHVVPIARAGQEVFMLARAALILTNPNTQVRSGAVGEALALMECD